MGGVVLAFLATVSTVPLRFNRRSATRWLGAMASRGLKPTATSNGRSATKHGSRREPGYTRRFDWRRAAGCFQPAHDPTSPTFPEDHDELLLHRVRTN